MLETLIALAVAVLIIGVLVWAAKTILGVIPVAEPWKTIAYVLIVVISVFVLLHLLGLLGGTGLRVGNLC